MFNDMFIDQYKNTLQEGLVKIDQFHEAIIVKLRDYESMTTNDDILRFIGYIFQYSHIYTLFTIVLANKEIINQFIRNEMEPTDKNKTIIMNAKGEIESWLPLLLNHDLTDKPQYPCLDIFQPISTTGKVGKSELYIAGLLSSFAINDNILLNAIENCISRIVDLSVSTFAFREHYNLVRNRCRYLCGMTGGAIYIAVDRVSRDLKKLGHYYISYIQFSNGKYNKLFDNCFNQISVSKFNLVIDEDYVFCFTALRSLVVNYGILREEFLQLLKKESYTVQEESAAMLGIDIDDFFSEED